MIVGCCPFVNYSTDECLTARLMRDINSNPGTPRLAPAAARPRAHSQFIEQNDLVTVTCLSGIILPSDLMKMNKLFRVSRLIPFALVLAALPVCAGDTNFTGTEWSLVDPQRTLAAAAGITPDKYPNCDAALVEERSVRDYRVDGTGQCQDETFTKVLTEKGKRDNHELAFSFMLPYWTVEVATVEVLKPGGTVVPVDVTANSKESIDDSQMAENIYDPNDRVLRVNIPQLEIGDVVYVVARQIIHRSIMPDEYDEENVLEGTSYIRHWSYEVHAPATLPLQRIALRDEIPGTVSSSTQTNGQQVDYRWEVNNVPRMFDEPDMPPYDMVLQRLFVSTVPSWEDISKWYWNLSKPHLDMTTPEMKRTVVDLTTNASSDLDKVSALFHYVSGQIRYMGLTPEKDRPGFEPHDVCLTFEKKYGVCRDKAGLLVAMLRLAGFDAYPVLINIGAKRDPAVPQPDFDHAIVCVELSKGEYTLMDPTDENTRDLLPSYDCNRSYLVCRPEGETLRVSPVPSPDQHMLLVKTSGTLDANGLLAATSELSFEGVNDDAYRNRFAHLKPDEQKRFFEERLKEGIPGLQLKSVTLTPENMLDVSVPLHAELKYTASGLTANGGGESVVSVPWITGDLGIANRILIGAAGLRTRKYPLDTEVTCGVREDLSLKLTGGFAAPLSIPGFSSISNDCVDYGEHIALTGTSLNCSRELKLETVEFSPAQYLLLKQTLKDMAVDRRKSPIMALKSKTVAEAAAAADRSAGPRVESNARILESRKWLDVRDAHTAVYHVKYSKRILTYDGKIREAEVKIEFNPACEEARIVHAAVISGTGGRQEISPGEINVMDQGWNAAAKRYTGGKVLVASLPGVDIGSMIEVEYEVTRHDMPFLSGFETFQFPDMLDDKTFELAAPTNLQIDTLVSGRAGVVKEQDRTASGIRTLRWRARNVRALPSEEQLPPQWNYDPGVEYFVGDVADYWQALRDAMLAHSQKSAKASELARRLAGPTLTNLDAVAAIRDFIAKNIREAGPSFTRLPLRELSDADTTLADGYGHAADRAILYYAMLSAAGFQPEFVMASDLPPVAGITNVTQSVPLPDQFQTPLVRISAGGEDYYLNDTDQYSRLGTTGCDGRLGIALSAQKMETVKAAKGCGDKTETDYAISLSADGSARIRISKHFYGRNYNETNRFFSELPPEERAHYFQEAVSRVAQGARAAGALKTDFATYPGLEEFTVDLDDYGVAGGKYLYFNLPSMPSLFEASTDQRFLPMFISDETKEVVRTEIELPAGFRLTGIGPKSERFVAPGGSQVQITRTSADGRCIVADEFETVPAIISPGDYPKLLNIESALGQKSETTFLLERD
jgi:transglutaminase-like putative cysteine protease